MKKAYKAIANFLYEVGLLARSPRSGFPILGGSDQSVAEHINRTVYIGYALASLEKNVDVNKVVMMCQFHDLAEARTGDLNYTHQKYVVADEYKAIKEMFIDVPFKDHVMKILNEYAEKKTLESQLAKDADNIEWILSLKENKDNGNLRMQSYIDHAVQRIKTKTAKDILEVILATDSHEFWMTNTKDSWWIHRNKKALKKRF